MEIEDATIKMLIDGQARLESAIDSGRDNVQTMLVQQASIKPEITQLREAVQINSKQTAKAHDKLDDVKADVATLKTDVSTLKQQHQTMKKKVAWLVGGITAFANGTWQWGKGFVGLE